MIWADFVNVNDAQRLRLKAPSTIPMSRGKLQCPWGEIQFVQPVFSNLYSRHLTFSAAAFFACWTHLSPAFHTSLLVSSHTHTHTHTHTHYRHISLSFSDLVSDSICDLCVDWGESITPWLFLNIRLPLPVRSAAVSYEKIDITFISVQ